MAVINFARREIIAKVLYYGPRGAGTTAILRRLYLETPGRPTGGLVPFGPSDGGESTLVFELAPEKTDLPGFDLRVRVYSLPGGLDDPPHRAEVIRDVDGVVFVADARRGRADPNLEALLELDRTLKALDLDLAKMPVVFAINHSDADDAAAADEVAYDLNPYGHPVFASSVKTGAGIREPLAGITGQIAALLRDNLAGRPTGLHVHAIHRREAAPIEQVVEAHQRAIEQARARDASRLADADGAPPWSRSHLDILPVGHTVRLAYLPAELTGMRPGHLLGARIEDEDVAIDLVLDDVEGASPTRLRVVLALPDDATTPAPHPELEVTPRPEPPGFSLVSTTQPTVEVTVADTGRTLGYALVGAGAGLTVGLLVGFLVWA
jgi:hypothetical protein